MVVLVHRPVHMLLVEVVVLVVLDKHLVLVRLMTVETAVMELHHLYQELQSHMQVVEEEMLIIPSMLELEVQVEEVMQEILMVLMEIMVQLTLVVEEVQVVFITDLAHFSAQGLVVLEAKAS
jgi:DNA mismatch repair ATPase MutL